MSQFEYKSGKKMKETFTFVLIYFSFLRGLPPEVSEAPYCLVFVNKWELNANSMPHYIS